MEACNLHTNFGPDPNDGIKKTEHQEVITTAASTSSDAINISTPQPWKHHTIQYCLLP
jgi:hypothetical protein